MQRKEPLKEILASTRELWDQPGIRPSVRANFEKVLKCRTEALGSEVYASSTEQKVVHHFDGGGLAKGGTVTMFINDKKVGEGRVDKTIYARFSADESFDTGLDTGSPVSNLYKSPFKFTGSLKKIEIELAPANLNAEELAQIDKAHKAVAAAVE